MTPRHPSMATAPLTPAPATFRDLQVPPVSRIDIEDALCEASLRPDVDAPHVTAPHPS